MRSTLQRGINTRTVWKSSRGGKTRATLATKWSKIETLRLRISSKLGIRHGMARMNRFNETILIRSMQIYKICKKTLTANSKMIKASTVTIR